MADSAYARAGVDTGQAGRGVAALVDVLRTIDTGRPSRAVLGSGHYANVLRLAGDTGLALSTDGVGTKLIVAEQLGRYDTVGIDCIAMNVNDVICVGADPIAVLDYVAVEEADPELLAAVGRGLKAGAQDAGVEIPGGELAVVPELIRGHPSPGGIDLVGMCVGLVEIPRMVTGAAARAGDAIVGLPSSGVHSNGFTLARSALGDLAEQPGELGRPDGGRGAARAHGDLRARHAGAAGLGPGGPRPGPHHRRGPAQPAATRGAGGLPDRLAAARAAHLRPDRGPIGRRRGRDARGLQHGLRLLRSRARRAGRSRPWRCWTSTTRARR
ncbi:MAG: AIR synthase related protein [Thermoleophilaceae bacterium]